jgi:hypothetical protein
VTKDEMPESLSMTAGRVEWRRVGDEIVVLDLADSRYLGVNPAGAVLWPLLGRGSSRDELADALVDAYGVGADTAREDVDRFVADLERHGLVTRADG